VTAVVDTSALVAIVLGEPDAADLARAIRSQPCVIATGTFVELHAVLGRSLSAEQIQAILDRLRITVTPTDALEAHVAARAYHRYGRGSGHPARLNFGDTLSYAAAKTRGLPLIFQGDDYLHTDVARRGDDDLHDEAGAPGSDAST
jgi:ribonuclease VapC